MKATTTLTGLILTYFNGRITSTGVQRTIGMQQTLWHMHDGAPAHFTYDTEHSLNSHYPDLMSADFYLCGLLKGIVYSKRVHM
jgi:hypothetical protein